MGVWERKRVERGRDQRVQTIQAGKPSTSMMPCTMHACMHGPVLYCTVLYCFLWQGGLSSFVSCLVLSNPNPKTPKKKQSQFSFCFLERNERTKKKKARAFLSIFDIRFVDDRKRQGWQGRGICAVLYCTALDWATAPDWLTRPLLRFG